MILRETKVVVHALLDPSPYVCNTFHLFSITVSDIRRMRLRMHANRSWSVARRGFHLPRHGLCLHNLPMARLWGHRYIRWPIETCPNIGRSVLLMTSTISSSHLGRKYRRRVEIGTVGRGCPSEHTWSAHRRGRRWHEQIHVYRSPYCSPAEYSTRTGTNLFNTLGCFRRNCLFPALAHASSTIKKL